MFWSHDLLGKKTALAAVWCVRLRVGHSRCRPRRRPP